MHFRNGDHGYGVVTKTLHWLTVTAIAAQFAVGLTMAADDEALDREKDRIKELEDMGEEQAERQGEAAEEQFESEIDRMEDALDVREDNYVADAFVSGELSLPLIHVLLGVSIVVLGVIRVLWRTTTPLPPWAAHLGPGERRFEAWLEKSLLTLLFVVPVTGLVLLTIGADWLLLHIAAQVALLAAIALHVGLVIRHTIVHRHRHLVRML